MPGYTDMGLPDKDLEKIHTERIIIAATQEKMASEAGNYVVYLNSHLGPLLDEAGLIFLCILQGNI